MAQDGCGRLAWQLSIDGYHDKLPALLSKAVDTLLHAADTVAPARFKDLLDRVRAAVPRVSRLTAVAVLMIAFAS